MIPVTVALLVASRYTGVFSAFLLKFSVAPEAMLIVVKLKMPLGGRSKVVSAVTFSAPSAPVLPETNWARTGRIANRHNATVVMLRVVVFIFDFLSL